MLRKLPGVSFINRKIDNFKNKTSQRINSAKETAVQGGILAVSFALLIWFSMFLYVVFYYTYVPSITHTRPIHLQFKTCDDPDSTVCSFPTAYIKLTRRQQLLMTGQRYKIYIDLEMPESPANKGIGMFMVCLEMTGSSATIVANSCRATMLHYQSWLLQIIKTFVYSPMYLFGSWEEKQTISVEMFEEFEDDPTLPVTDVYIEIQSRKIELYSATLRIHAHFTGLRYLMFHWPVLSALVGITTNLSTILFVITLSWYHLFYVNENVARMASNLREQFTSFVDTIEPDQSVSKFIDEPSSSSD